MSKRAQDIATSGAWPRLINVLAGFRRDVQELRATLTSRQRIVLAVFLVFLSIQVAIPLVQLAGDRPERFGWQMFAGSRTHPDFEIVKTDGNVQAVDATDHLGYLRLELEYAVEFADHLCGLDADTVAVRILNDGSGADETRPCR